MPTQINSLMPPAMVQPQVPGNAFKRDKNGKLILPPPPAYRLMTSNGVPPKPPAVGLTPYAKLMNVLSGK